MQRCQRPEGVVNREATVVADPMTIRDDELVLLAHVRNLVTPAHFGGMVWTRRSRGQRRALVTFKEPSKIAAHRLETLTRLPIVFTITLAALAVVLVVHDLTP
jgi:hypothetical protein